MSGKEPAEMTVAVLREELKRRGLDTTGLKAVLVERLRGAIDAEATGGDRPTEKQKASDDLHDAAKRGVVDAVRELIEAGADVN